MIFTDDFKSNLGLRNSINRSDEITLYDLDHDFKIMQSNHPKIRV